MCWSRLVGALFADAFVLFAAEDAVLAAGGVDELAFAAIALLDSAAATVMAAYVLSLGKSDIKIPPWGQKSTGIILALSAP